MLQAQLRGHLARKEWKHKRDAVILLQAYTRGMLARKALNKTKRHVSSTPDARVYLFTSAVMHVYLVRIAHYTAVVQDNSFTQFFHGAFFLQMLLSAKQKEEEQQLMLQRQAYLKEVLRQAKQTEAKAQAETVTDQEIVDSFFDFLPLMSGEQDSQGFEV